MFDQIPFLSVDGTRTKPRVRMLALSTCGFCRRGQEFLAEFHQAYEYVHLDTLDPGVKAQVKQEFKDKFGVTLSYPALVIDDERQTVGFVRRYWEELLGLGDAADAESVN